MAVAIQNFSQLQRLAEPRTSSAAQLYEAARLFDEIRGVIDDNWQEIEPKDKDRLRALAYKIADIPKGMDRLSLLPQAWALLKGEVDAITKFHHARKRFVDAVLNRVEQDNPEYQQALSDVLSDIAAGNDRSPAMTTDEFRDWLRQL